MTHAAFGNKQTGPANASLTWSDLMDPGPAGMWYHLARGSGIFYRTVRVRARVKVRVRVGVGVGVRVRGWG